ncbi:MAG: hypothetical protein H7289_07800 [Mucilaginibacter sp.]|nr:hypothetical protein [Mucilaginibacter sp.]
MAFITKEEFATHIHPEIMDLISRADDAKILVALETGKQQAESYLSRFDLPAIFSATGNDKVKYTSLITFIKDLGKWHFINLVNPNIDLALAEKRYDDAIKELGKIQAGKTTPRDWPLAIQPESAIGQFKITSRIKRGNHY